MSGDVLLSCDSLERRHGERTLFSGLSFGVFEGDRIGLVGPNGSGKSTLLCILAGLEEADGGSVTRSRHLSIGFVPQVPDLDSGLTAREAAAEALSELELPPHELWPRAEAALSRAGLASPSQLVGTLSGGWRKRLAIAGQLAREPDLLLLDEPTNHLDLDGILWLEALLVDQRRSCVVVSHDRRLLENVSTRVLELSRVWPSGIFGSEGGYEAFLEKRDQALEAQASDQASLANVVRRELAWLSRGPKARTTKSRARIQEATRLGEELGRAKERSATGTAGLDFSATGRKSKRLLMAEDVNLSLGGRPIVSGLNLSLVNGTRLGLIGPNGSGKTTLLRLLAGELRPDEGRIERAPGLAVVRFEQDRESLDPALSLKAALAPTGDTVIFRDRPIHVSGWARRFLFRSEQLSLPVGRLSGGEQARVLLARLMLQPADLLLLDEPTNDLDIDTLEVLEESLIDFPGSLVLVTHDRHLLDRVATTLLSIEEGGRVESHADLAQWEVFRRAAMKRDRDAASRPTGAGERSPGQRGRSEAKGLKRLSYLERQEWAAMEETILAAEARAERCRAAASDPTIATDAATLAARHAELEVAEGEVERLYARWAELEARQG